jgi:Cu+-exporting ATPase
MTTTTVKDPVCGLEVKVSSAGPRTEYKGQTYSFWCSGCTGKFDHAPAQYTGEFAAAAKSDKSGSCCG